MDERLANILEAARAVDTFENLNKQADALRDLFTEDAKSKAEDAKSKVRAEGDTVTIKRALSAAARDPDEAERILRERFGAPGPPEPLPFETWDWNEKKHPPEREWVIPNLIPAGRLSALYGRGGAGKSFLMLQLANALMHGKPCLKLHGRQSTEQAGKHENERDVLRPVSVKGSVLWVGWEDEKEELARRWKLAHEAGAIATEYPDPKDLHQVDMRALHDASWVPDKQQHIATMADWTAVGKRFVRTLEGHRLCIVDPLAGAYLCRARTTGRWSDGSAPKSTARRRNHDARCSW